MIMVLLDLGDYLLLASGCDDGDIGVHKINRDIEINPAGNKNKK